MTTVIDSIDRLVGEARTTIGTYEPRLDTGEFPVDGGGTEIVESQVLRFTRHDVGTVIIGNHVTVDWKRCEEPNPKERIYVDFKVDDSENIIAIEPAERKVVKILDLNADAELPVGEDDIDRAIYLLRTAREVKTNSDARVDALVGKISHITSGNMEPASTYDNETIAAQELTIRVYDQEKFRTIELIVSMLTDYVDGDLKNWHLAELTISSQDSLDILYQLDIDTRKLYLFSGGEDDDDEPDDVTYEQVHLDDFEEAFAVLQKLAT